MVRLGVETPREYLFGEQAMSTALDLGIFPEYQPRTAYKQIAPKATYEALKTVMDWSKQLKSVTRMGNLLTPPDEPTPAAPPMNANDVRPKVAIPRDIDAAVIPIPTDATDFESRINRKRLEILNADQLRAYTIVERQIIARLKGEPTKQLLMLVLGQGGTGKSLLINAITQTFAELGILHQLAKTASSGVAASLIGGETLHGWAGIPINPSRDGSDWTEKGNNTTRGKRSKNIEGKTTWLHDELSMSTKEHLCLVSQAVGKILVGEMRSDATQPFGDIDSLLFGDFHQFPPVRNIGGALYCDRPDSDKALALVGREIYLQFNKVVILKEQKRIRDPVWNRILTHLRDGACDAEDLREIRSLVLTNEECQIPNFDSNEWSETILVTPRHSVRNQWNTAALMKHCTNSGNRLYICQADDTIGKTGIPTTMAQQLIIAGMNTKSTGKLPERVEIAIGMKAMVLLNIATEAEIANGTRGEVIDIALDPREHTLNMQDDGRILLRYPPSVILFKPDLVPSITFEGLPPGIIPISPTEVTFRISTTDKQSHQIRRRQLAITAAYAFTDYKSQGQTIERVIVDLAKPPTGELTPFSAYVALSRSRGRDTIRLLRDFDDKLFTTHPSEELRLEDIRLGILDRQTTI